MKIIEVRRLARIHKRLERFMHSTMKRNDMGLATMLANEGYFIVNNMIAPILIEETKKANNGNF